MTGLLGLFPSFESSVFGGVQETGRQAWSVLKNQSALDAKAFLYEAGTSRVSAAADALRCRSKVDTLLVWHCGLLKLTPFIASSIRRRVVFLHGIEAWHRHDAFTSWLLRRTHLFLSNSDYTWQRFLVSHPECSQISHRTVSLGCGVPLDEVPSCDAVPAAIMIGRMQKGEDYKGHREMIGLWPQVLESIPAARLWIVGGGDLRQDLEQLVQTARLTASVTFFGAIPEAEKNDLLRRCRVLALPSAGEGFGLVYLEAMRMGKPCLVSNIDAGREVVNPPEAGLVADLPAILRLLSAGSDWDEMSARARHRYDSTFTEMDFQQRLLAALAE